MPDYESEYMRDRGHSCKKSAQGMGKEFIAGEGGVTQGRFVMFAGTDDITVILCTAAGPLIGVAMDTVDAGDTVGVQMDGYHWVHTHGEPESTLVGQWVDSGLNGYAKAYYCPTAGNETTLGGYVLSSVVEDYDCICLKIQPKKLCGAQGE